MNSFGSKLRLTTFGESHGKGVGGVIDGFPACFHIDFEKLYEEIDKRRPGLSSLTTARKEDDRPIFLSGITDDGFTLGTPIGFYVPNKDHRSSDYDSMKDLYRPNHADYVYQAKYGIRDHRGGGRASARETLSRVIAGALALQWLNSKGIEIKALLSGVGDVEVPDFHKTLSENPSDISLFNIDAETEKLMHEKIEEARRTKDSVGGKVTCLITGVPVGIGEPVGDKLQANLAGTMMSINAAKAFEYGFGFRLSSSLGSETADEFTYDSDGSFVKTKTNYSGGIQGGISNGMPIFFSVYFKPTPTIGKPLNTINTLNKSVILEGKGRHDPCVALRAVAVVKAMASLVIADFLV